MEEKNEIIAAIESIKTHFDQYATTVNGRLEIIEKEVQRLTALHAAFPKNEEGELMLEEHHDEHAARWKKQGFWRRIFEHALGKVAENLVTAIMVAGLVLFGLGLQQWAGQWLGVTNQAVASVAVGGQAK